MRHMKSTYPFLLAAIAAAVLTACGGAVSTPSPEPDPPHPLVGTWQRTFEGTDEADDGTMTETRVEQWLTFTGERAISVWDIYDAATGAHLHSSSDSSGWEADDSTVTRYWTPADYESPPPGDSIEKTYRIDGDTLVIDAWALLREATHTNTLTRVASANLPTIIGTWHTAVTRVEVGRDSFAFRDIRDDGTIWALTGTVDAIEDGIVELSNLQETTYTADAAEEVITGPERWEEGTGRLGFVPSHRGIVISMPWNETAEERPYGFYAWNYPRR